jgi:hypothetical protein
MVQYCDAEVYARFTELIRSVRGCSFSRVFLFMPVDVKPGYVSIGMGEKHGTAYSEGTVV